MVKKHDFLRRTSIILQELPLTIKRFHFKSHFVEDLHENTFIYAPLSENAIVVYNLHIKGFDLEVEDNTIMEL